MSALELTKTRMKEGVWEGILTTSDPDDPQIIVTHEGRAVDGVALTHDPDAGHWVVQVPIPMAAIADGVQTLIIQDARAQSSIGHVTLIAGEALGDDIRAEMDLLRAELDMLKRAFRRHCLETA
ncbi:hypothetical protein [Sulfitobacter aestuariivivens]|uniref:Uncharacterized protein n=1 Tax=Sulfitobacter aestuariivivens TaxID=2766981 RepID=A0A927HF90_9RHOB|nr:hypothetical protein [Sulfitobacter aestuariivivens]MBD3665602.1 hypothetical protein [Sulfitobacter aestuariivivens]